MATTRVWSSLLICWLGDFSTGLEQLQEAIQVARDSGDEAPQAWAEGLQGVFRAIAGDLDGGIRAQQMALEVLDRLPDHHGAVGVRGSLARCHLWRGALEQAQETIDAARLSIAKHNVRGLACTSVVLAEAEADLLRAGRVSERDRIAALDRAQRSCRRAIEAGKLDSAAVPAAHRDAGACAWLRGKPNEARAFWQLSLDAAERMGARYEVGLTLLEMGSRLGDSATVEQAEALLGRCGAEFDRRRAQNVLAGLTSGLLRSG